MLSTLSRRGARLVQSGVRGRALSTLGGGKGGHGSRRNHNKLLSNPRAVAALEHASRSISGLSPTNKTSDVQDMGGGLGGTSGVSKRTDRKCTLVLEDG